MKVEYAKRALSDILDIAAYCASCDNLLIGEQIADRLQEVVERIARFPESAREAVAGRPGMRVAPLVRYPYNVFYAVKAGKVRILHIRHTARRPWTGGRVASASNEPKPGRR